MPVSLLVILSAAMVLALAVIQVPWGPGTHIQLTVELLERLRRKQTCNPAQKLALKYPQPFLYGNIAADIINFKSYGGIKNHCHNWNIHERLDGLAESPAARAFTLGYLCHLSADVVAHNHFVPYHIVYNFPPRILAHPYWEAMADGRVSDGQWHAIDRLKKNPGIHAFDRLVHRAVRWKALGLRSNKWIFNNILLITCRQRWREMIRVMESSAKRHPLDDAFYLQCRRESLRRMLAVFHPRRLAVLKVSDPTGKVALQGATRLRRELLRDFGQRSKARTLARHLAQEAYGKL
jgi:hypothetical protein